MAPNIALRQAKFYLPQQALRQAKFYLPWQAAAASDCVLRLPQYTSRSTRADCIPARVLWHPPPLSTLAPLNNLVYCGGAAVGFDAPQYKPFYIIPNYYLLLFELNIIFNYLNTILR